MEVNSEDLTDFTTIQVDLQKLKRTQVNSRESNWVEVSDV